MGKVSVNAGSGITKNGVLCKGLEFIHFNRVNNPLGIDYTCFGFLFNKVAQ